MEQLLNREKLDIPLWNIPFQWLSYVICILVDGMRRKVVLTADVVKDAITKKDIVKKKDDAKEKTVIGEKDAPAKEEDIVEEV